MPKSYSNAELRSLASKLGKSVRTLRYWVAQGCDLENKDSVRKFVEHKTIKAQQTLKATVARACRGKESSGVSTGERSRPDHSARRKNGKPKADRQRSAQARFETPGNELPPAGRKGAAAALERLEAAEESAHRRLEAALASGDRFRIQDAQEFWLKCSETLRRLDLAVEVARRQEETQIPLKTAEAAVTAVAEWMRVAVTTFLSSETISLMGIKDSGAFRSYFGQRFVANLHLIIKSADKTHSAIPDWAKESLELAWNLRIE